MHLPQTVALNDTRLRETRRGFLKILQGVRVSNFSKNFAKFKVDFHNCSHKVNSFERLKNMQEPAEDYNVTVATRMYAGMTFKYDIDFKKIAKSVLDINVTRMDFSNGQDASENINSWVRDKTRGKIQELFAPGLFLALCIC